METSDHLKSLRIDGGHPALDLVNTLGGLLDAPPNPWDEHLRSYGDLIAWSARVAILAEPEGERLLDAAGRRPEEAEAVLAEALQLRQLVDDLARPLAFGSDPPARALRALREAEREALAHAELRPAGLRLRWTWASGEDLRAPLYVLTHAAVDLLTQAPLERLKHCGNCRWLFIDRSKNRSRRWCSMEECGTAVKKRRYSERRRSRSG